MTDQIKAMLDEAAHIGEPPSHVNGDEIVLKGRKRNRARRFGVGGGATLGVAGLTAVALLLTPVDGGQTDERGAAADTVEQPEFELPDIDVKPGEKLQWLRKSDEESGPTKETEAFSAAFWEHLENEYDDIGIADNAENTIEPLTDANMTAMTRDFMWLNYVEEDSEPTPVQHDPIPRYQLHTEVSLDREDVIDAIEVTVYPKGSFEAGAGTEHDYRNLYTCDHRDGGPEGVDPTEATRDCTEETGPGGEKIARIKTEHEVYDEFAGSDLQVVVYRADGTAIVVRDVFATKHLNDVDRSGEKLTLDLDQLTELALALPDDVLVG